MSGSGACARGGDVVQSVALDLAIGKVNDGYLEPLSYITAGSRSVQLKCHNRPRLRRWLRERQGVNEVPGNHTLPLR